MMMIMMMIIIIIIIIVIIIIIIILKTTEIMIMMMKISLVILKNYMKNNHTTNAAKLFIFAIAILFCEIVNFTPSIHKILRFLYIKRDTHIGHCHGKVDIVKLTIVLLLLYFYPFVFSICILAYYWCAPETCG